MAPRRWFTLLAALLLAATTLIGIAGPAQAAVATTGFKAVDITGGDGVILKANVIGPATAGRHPAVVLPSSWGLNDLEYLAQAKVLAGRGYVVVSYTPRGWWLSGGEIDTAGPKDMADLSKVVDWTIANTAADPARIGAAGISYGAGISLLGSAFDPRIRAVGVLSGWTDLVYSLYADSTRHRQSAGLLELAAQIVGKPSADLTDKMADFNANRDVAEVMAWAKVRSATSYVDAINANRPAVLIANAWGDTFFPPNQMVDFYGRLTTPKRLELRPGDHAIAELTGVLGLPNDVWTSLYAWLDQHLKGTGSTGPNPVQVKPLNASYESYPDWSALTGTDRRYGLGRIRLLDGTGLLGGNPSSGWTKSIPTDKDTVAGGGIVLITNGAAAITGEQPKIWLPFVDRGKAGVWAAERPSTVQKIRGSAKLHLELSGAESKGTVVAYLYDLDAVGNAKLITHAPATWLSGGGSRDVDLRLPATAYDLPAGHSLTLVIDTVDPLYYEENASGDAITVGGGSYLDVPLR
ncbi:CocE/NonD family hydrolase [Actinoplanes aureus]|uniref:Prolyl oligopeptidase family serine peptidase n=1 Tax=Actinoplanes aureus TaxID=2792083 RepID=A0A931CEH1_9ACTN|nr:CocE/NonD family hydrolase [Actinoplanes aureus]MBG0567124.1 prolyl oligopeptidase family serine peptidase [Actinoplanes aureus]